MTPHDPMSRRAILAGIAAAPMTALPAVAVQASADPIFAVIAEHQRNEQAYRAAESQREDDEIIDPLFVEEGDEFEELLAATPTTLAGIAALLRYLQAHGERWEMRPIFAEYVSIDTGDDLLGRLADAIDAAGKAVQSWPPRPIRSML